MHLVPVILCGGSGTRLWPLSRTHYPKQLLRLAGDHSLLQDTLRRLDHLAGPPEAPLVVCNEAHRFLVERQLAEIGCRARIVLEPEGRNTAPAVALAAAIARRDAGQDVLLLVLPADHVIRDPGAFRVALEAARGAAEGGQLVTFGVVPSSPETGYGYIAAGPGGGAGVRSVRQFVEKPDFETARKYVQSGQYLWNSGMFLFSADAYLGELAAHAPEIAARSADSAAGAAAEGAFIIPGRDAFLACPKDSIDYAVMERTGRAAVVPLDAGWSDVGSWSSLRDIGDQDGQGNVLDGDVLALDCRGTSIRAESRLVAAVGLEDCVVVETPDAVLVVPAARAQDVRKLVDELEARGRVEARLGREVHRPWGSFDSLHDAPGFQVKQLTVLPGAKLSLQLHHRRAEHWVVVAGRARVTRNDEIVDLGVGEHIFIPLGARHRIENPGPAVLRIIEVQVGDYLGEDDIVRIEDDYGRRGRTD